MSDPTATQLLSNRMLAMEILQLVKAEIISIPEARVMLGLPAVMPTPDPDDMSLEQLRAEVRALRKTTA